MSQNKVYGLILPKKGNQAQEKKAASSTFNVFGDDSDEEVKEQTSSGPFGQGKASTMKRQAQIDIDKALKDDPNIYEYDSIYDEMQASKPKVSVKEKESSNKDKKSKYIVGLLKQADVKKREDERRKERQVQKEREEEGAKFADKESFVTSAYKKKMLEMQAEEEKERRQAEFEAMTDVTKQKDMSGFYRYLYRQTTGGPDVKPEVKPELKPETSSEEPGNDGHSGDSVKKEQSALAAIVKEEPPSPEANRKLNETKKSKRRTGSPSGSDTSASDTERPEAERLQDIQDIPLPSDQRKPASKRSIRKRVDSSSDSESLPEPDVPDPKAKSSKSSSRHGQSKPVRKRSSSGSQSPLSQPKSLKKSHKENRRRRQSSSAGEEDGLPTEKQTKPQEKNSSRHTDDDEDRDKSTSDKGDIDENIEENIDENIADNLREIRNKSDENLSRPSKENEVPKANVDPAKKVYPHHNSAKDIQEARKRYLQRKIARESAKRA